MKVWIVSVLLCAAFTLQITEGAAVISPKEGAEIPPENFPEISLEAAEIYPENLAEISPEEAADIYAEAAEISPENNAEISPEEAAEIYAEAAEISPENNAEISPEEAAEIYAEEAKVPEYEQNIMNEPSGRSVICPPGWFRYGIRCFLIVRSGSTWLNAQAYCVNNHATLASVHSLSEYNILQSLLTVSGYSHAWIGAYNFLGTWMWKDNTGFYYTNWQSQSGVSSNPCAYMTSTGGWSNGNCGSGYYFICAMKPSTC